MLHSLTPNIPGKGRCTDHDEILRDLVDKYLKTNGIKSITRYTPSMWSVRYAGKRLDRKDSSETYEKLCRIYTVVLGSIVNHKVITHYNFEDDGHSISETYIVIHSDDGVELANFNKLYAECYNDFFGWCNTIKSKILSLSKQENSCRNFHFQRPIDEINEFMDRICQITESDGKIMDIPLKVPREYKSMYWRLICLINMLDFVGYVDCIMSCV